MRAEKDIDSHYHPDGRYKFSKAELMAGLGLIVLGIAAKQPVVQDVASGVLRSAAFFLEGLEVMADNG